MSKILRGDTLIEVALALGILGFVIVSVTAVMANTLNASQYSLEETMARNEIDVQAEALRYVHNAYIAQKNLTSASQEYRLVWNAITNLAITPDKVASLSDAASCDEFYGGSKSIFSSEERSFIINTHRLGTNFTQNAAITNQIIIPSTTATTANKFGRASVYPRVLYGGVSSLNESLLASSNSDSDTLYRAEGIWITAVCADNTSNCQGNNSGSKPTYYDFYIRTCWDSSNDHGTSTLGSVIRLHNPEVDITPIDSSTKFTINYYANNGASQKYEDAWDFGTHIFNVANRMGSIPATNTQGWPFVGWCVNYTGSNTSCNNVNSVISPGTTITADLSNGTSNLSLIAVYRNTFNLEFYSNAPAGQVYDFPSNESRTCHTISTSGIVSCSTTIPSTQPKRNGYVFLGWATSAGATVADPNYAPGRDVTVSGTLRLYAIWQTATNSEWAVMASWSSGCRDVDSHTYIYNNGTQLGHIYYSNRTGTFNGTKVTLDHDYTSPGNTETTTIDNLTTSGNIAYVCLHCYSGSTSFTGGGLKVVVTSPSLNLYNTHTASSSTSASYWSVVKIQGSSVSVRDSLSCNPGW